MDGGLCGGAQAWPGQVGMGWVVPEQQDLLHLNQPHAAHTCTPVGVRAGTLLSQSTSRGQQDKGPSPGPA